MNEAMNERLLYKRAATYLNRTSEYKVQNNPPSIR